MSSSSGCGSSGYGSSGCGSSGGSRLALAALVEPLVASESAGDPCSDCPLQNSPLQIELAEF